MAIARDAFVPMSARDILAAMALAGAFGGLAAGQVGATLTTLLAMVAIVRLAGGGIQRIPVLAVQRARRPLRRGGTP